MGVFFFWARCPCIPGRCPPSSRPLLVNEEKKWGVCRHFVESIKTTGKWLLNHAYKSRATFPQRRTFFIRTLSRGRGTPVIRAMDPAGFVDCVYHFRATGMSLQDFNFHWRAKARIWPWLSHVPYSIDSACQNVRAKCAGGLESGFTSLIRDPPPP